MAVPFLAVPEVALAPVNEVGDDRDNLQPGEPLLLIIENDLSFARLLLDVAHDKGFKALVTSLGATALVMTRDYRPSAITRTMTDTGDVVPSGQSWHQARRHFMTPVRTTDRRASWPAGGRDHNVRTEGYFCSIIQTPFHSSAGGFA